ncbi:MAG TPA: FAD-binding oxidoreductase [Gaiellaceae bacterium]|nr:FAD-binding oxidoreductase [Gaiellaceae bacterium]
MATTELRLRGRAIAPDDREYDEARKLHNGMFDRRPALIARCVDVDDVVAAVEYGREQGLDTAIRCGGHNAAGLGSVDHGLVIDLRDMNQVRVDPDENTAYVDGGCLLQDVDAATAEHGLVTPAGIISTTGAGGLVLGGGIGHLTRKLGLSIDNLVGAQVVLANGSVVEASPDENQDLYWAIRGGGGNFGVVTQLRLRLHPLGSVVAGPMFWPIEHAADLLAWYREFLPAAPRELGCFYLFHTVPPAPPFPEELQLQRVCGVACCWTGPVEDANDALAEVRAQPGLALDGVAEVPFPAFQAAFDPIYPAGDQWYWRTAFVGEVSDEAIEVNVEFGRRMPRWKSLMHLYPIDGAVHDVGSADTAWPARDAQYAQVIAGVDPDPANADAIRAWAVEYSDAIRPYASGAGYVNFMMDEGQDRVRATYGPNYERLVEVKRRYDPDNVFHVNQNIRP